MGGERDSVLMAKIVVYSMAYRGDVFPYVPIASELGRRGHDVVFVVPREYHPLFAGEPFRCVHREPTSAPDVGRARGVRRSVGQQVRRCDAVAPLLRGVHDSPPSGDVRRSRRRVGRRRPADLHPAAAVVGSMAAELRGVPVLVGDLFPMILPSEFSPLMGMPYLGRRVNRALIRLARSGSTDRLTGADDSVRSDGTWDCPRTDGT